MSTEFPSPPAPEAGKNQQTSATLIQILTLVIPGLFTIIGSLILFSQRRMELQIPISTTQTLEARQTFIAASNAMEPTAIINATNSPVASAKADNVDVIINNPDPSSPSVRLIIKQGDQVVTDLILPPGGTAPRINLPPGNYQVEARPIYVLITPKSENCSIQWQVGDAYKRDLVITSGESVIQIQQFDFEPNEICLTETPPP